MVQAEDKCRTTHNLTALSFTTASIACTLSITTIATNSLMMYIICKGNRSRLRSSVVASGALINTVISDLLTGILTDIIVTASHIIEGLQTSVRREILVAGHIVHFLTTGAALISVTLLCIDRIIALLFPIYYQNSKIRLKTWQMFLITWATSSLFLISYFRFGFIKHLAVYASINITFPAILMVFTIIAYREKFIKRTFSRRRTKSSCSQVDPLETSPRIEGTRNGFKRDSDRFLTVPAAFQLKEANGEQNIDTCDVPWSTYNSLPTNTNRHKSDMKMFFPEIAAAATGETSFLQQIPNARHHSEGALLTQNADDVQVERKSRTSSVRFVDDNLYKTSNENIRSQKTKFSFFKSRSGKSKSFTDDTTRRQKKASIDAGSDSSFSIPASPSSNHMSVGSCRNKLKRNSRTDKRLMRALIINLCVFMLAYTPSICFIIYLNTCMSCNCTVVHVLRDAVGLFVRSASLLRPLTFLICTKSLKDFIRKFRK